MRSSLISLILPLVLCDIVSALIEFTAPRHADILKGGKATSVKWQYSSTAELQSPDSSEFNLYLCAGGNEVDSYVSRAAFLYPYWVVTDIFSIHIGKGGSTR